MSLEDLPEGNILLLVRYADGSHFRDTDPFSLAQELDRLHIGTITANPILSGALLVRMKTKTAQRHSPAKEVFSEELYLWT